MRRTAALLASLATIVATMLALLPAAGSAGAAAASPQRDGPQARVWVTTPDGTAEAQRPGQRRLPSWRLGGSDDHRRPVPLLPAHGRVRRLDHRLFRAGALPARPRDPRRDDARPVQPLRRRRPGRPPAADGRLGLRRGRPLHLRRRAGRSDRLSRWSTSASGTTARRSCRCCEPPWRTTPTSRSSPRHGVLRPG